MKERVKWLDVLKFIGIIEIYLGHMNQQLIGELSYKFVFTHHVPLFFFAAGCALNLSKEKDKPFLDVLKSRFKSLIIPWFVFAVFALPVNLIVRDLADLPKLKHNILQIMLGTIRNTYFAGSLWFITCMFVTSILFNILQRMTKGKKPLLITISILCCMLSAKFIGPPKWIFNIDSALYYMPFYAIGYVAFPYMNNLFKSEEKKDKYLLIGSAIITFIFMALVYVNMNPLKKIPNVDLIITSGGIVSIILTPLIIIWFMCLVSWAMQHVSFGINIGKNTLYHCGNEYLMKQGVYKIFRTVGVGVPIKDQFSTLTYCIVLLTLSNYLVAPIEKKLFKWINKGIDRLWTKENKVIE